MAKIYLIGSVNSVIKVIYLLDNLNIGGAERSLLEILSRFKTTTPVMVHVDPANALQPAYDQAGIRVQSLGVRGKYPYFAALRRFVDLLEVERPDLIHVCGFKSMFIARLAARWAGIPLIDSFNNNNYDDDAFRILPYASRCKLRLGLNLDRATFRWVKQVIAVSETVRNSNAEKIRIPLEKITLIYRGRDPSPYVQSHADAVAMLRQSLSLGSDQPVVLNVARLIPRKGHEELVRAFQRVRTSLDSARLLIAGEGYYRPVLEDLVRECAASDGVQLLGTRTDVPALLALCDVFAFPSWREGMSGAVLEAMFSAKPIVAFDCPINREMIKDGETGLLVRFGSHEALAEGILHILRNPAEGKRMGERAREDAMNRFHIDQVSKQHELAYERILRNH